MKRFRIIGFLAVVFVPLTLLLWQRPDVRGWVQPTAVLPTRVPTAVVGVAASPTAVPTLPPTLTKQAPSLPTSTPTQTATATATTMPPTATLPPTNTPIPPTETPAPTAAAVSVLGEPCPDPAPLKPLYNSYYLSPTFWPKPNPALMTPHFWLAKPLPGGGRYLINQTFPYGSDGNGRYLLHNGVDTAGQLGTPVLAAADGTVVVAQADTNRAFGWRCDWYGHAVIIELDEQWQMQPIYLLYGHVLNIQVKPGEHVKQGQQVAEVGVGGAATASHLHFEVRVGGMSGNDTRNPMLWVYPGSTRGVIAGRLVDPEGRPWQGVTVTLIPQVDNPEYINTYTYMYDPLQRVSPNPDEGWAENFVFSDVEPGEYVVYTKLQGNEYRVPVTVTAGDISPVEIVTAPYQGGE